MTELDLLRAVFVFVCSFLFGETFCNSGGWRGEPRGQEYAMQHGERVLFWIPDEQPPQYGTAYYAWGYYPMILGDDGRSREFRQVQWIVGNL